MIPIAPTLEVLAVAGLLAMAPVQMEVMPTLPATRTPAVLELDASRLALTGTRDTPRRIFRSAAGLGAALAWDLAAPPRHHARPPEPVGEFTAGAAFAGGAVNIARRDGSEAALDVLIHRWNTLYPPYALEGMNDT